MQFFKELAIVFGNNVEEKNASRLQLLISYYLVTTSFHLKKMKALESNLVCSHFFFLVIAIIFGYGSPIEIESSMVSLHHFYFCKV